MQTSKSLNFDSDQKSEKISDILEDTENFLLKRREVKVVVEADKNPTFEEAVDTIAGQFKGEKENIAIKQVKGKFGRDTFLISAFIYRNKEDKEKLEKKKEKKKKEEPEQEKAEEKPAEKKA